MVFKSYEFYIRFGFMEYEDYPYTSGSTDKETPCKHDQSKVKGYAARQGRITASV